MLMSRSVQGLAATAFLLAGTSVLALTLGSSAAQSRGLNGGSGGAPAPTIASEAAAQAAQQALAATRQTQESLARAARAMQDIQGVQAAARAAAAATQTSVTSPIAVPNGLGAGALLPNAPQTWSNANAPSQSVDGNGQTQVGIRQTAAQAIIDWKSFNVGARTTLTFDQQGHAGWVALNRVDASTGPSQILGNIKADGQVYVVNQSGIIFGGSSQINVGALIASTAVIAEDQFRNKGLFSTLSGTTYQPTFTAAGGKVVVEAGASIQTAAPTTVTSGGGYVLMIGSDVSNAGAITTPKGQTILAAGRDFILRPGFGTDSNQLSTTRGSEIAVVAGTTGGRVVNTGIVWAQQGDVTLTGRTLVQDGVLLSSTAVSQRGTIHLLNSVSDSAGSVTLTGNSVSLIMPELESKDTALNSQRDALIAASGRNGQASGQFDNLSALTDRRDQSRVEIVSGGLVDVQRGSLTMAQGGQIAVSAAGRVYAEQGSVVDVSGVQGVLLPMAANQMQVNVQGNELKDSPINRESGLLINKSVWIDLRDLVYVAAGTGGYAGERYYTAGGLLEIGGYVANTAHRIGEWAAVGGTITLAAPEVVAQRGAKFNISGGSIGYQSGWIYSTKLIGTDGRLYSFDDAPASMKFVAAAGGFVRTHNINGQVSDQLTEAWTSIFDRSTSRRWEDGYTVGRDAGRLNLSTPTPIFEADLIADVIKGERQSSARAANLSDGYKQVQNAAPLQGTLGLGRYDVRDANSGFYNSDVRFGDVAPISAGLSATDALPSARKDTAWFDAGLINAQQLGGLDIATGGKIVVERPVSLADGGKISLIAPLVDVRADVTARGGSLTVDNYFAGDTVGGRGREAVLLKDDKAEIVVRDGVKLDMRGLWVNLQDTPSDINKQAYVDGGAVTLRSTHDVTLEKGGTIDVSSGAAVLANGKTKGGRGGNVTLIADAPNTVVQPDGLLTLDGAIRAYGVSGGGTLKLESGTAVSIGGKVMANNGVLGAGETAQADFVLAKDYLVKAGEALPGDYTYQSNVFMPGDVITENASFANVVLAADWYPPKPAITRVYYIDYKIGNVAVRTEVWNASEKNKPIAMVPAGAILTAIGSLDFLNPNFGSILPAAQFPNGVPSLAAFSKTIAAGTVVKDDTLLVAGTRLATGFAPVRVADVKPVLQLDASLFQSGFSSYDITARNSVTVAKGAIVDVAMPVYRLAEDAFSVSSGADPARALVVWTPPEWTENPRSATLTQRSGASITLRAARIDGTAAVANGPINIGEGASIRVDGGQSINLQGFDFTIDGRLTAPGGTISLTQPAPAVGNQAAFGTKPGLIWIGAHAVLDVAARAVTATDLSGQTYGVVGNGGSILIGGAMDWESNGISVTPTSFVVIRPGALLDASGANAVLDIPASGLSKGATPLAVASDGGSIIIKSGHGLYLDGTMRAAAGGVHAAGGTLALALEAPMYEGLIFYGDVLRHRELVVADRQGDSPIAYVSSPTAAKSQLVTGTARLGVDRIRAGGFGNLSLLVDGVLSFDGDVTLTMAQSLRLDSGAIGITEATASNARIVLDAPYVRLAGVNRSPDPNYVLPAASWVKGGPSALASDAAFDVIANLIDIRDTVDFGITQAFVTRTIDYTLDRRGFASIGLTSRGDLRLLADMTGSSLGSRLLSPGNITLTAGQIYPAAGARGTIAAGYRTDQAFIRAGSVLDIRRYGDTPDMPYAVFGTLTLSADIVRQGGVVRAPFGNITLGKASSGGDPLSDTVVLLPGSITSVSGNGLVMPYGGTMDGIVYSYNGSAVALRGGGGLGGVNLVTTHLEAQAGSVVDLSGGGELTGAGFISGRGGSVNVLTTPLVNANPGYTYSSKGNQVYAIVPSRAGGYAPAVQEAGAGIPAIGREITVPEGVPGLKAGTYMLMPATYALLPGAYRVELGRTISSVAVGAVPTGDGSFIVGAVLGVANTAIRSSLPVQAIITSADKVRTHSSYNEMDYNAFVLADAARLGVPRAALTIDAGLLSVSLTKSRNVDGRSQLRFDSDLRIDAADESDGFGGTVELHGISEIMAAGQIRDEILPKASVYADELSKFNAPRLVLNGSVAVSYKDSARLAYISADTDSSIVLRSGARLSAAEVIFAARSSGSGTATITIEEGASVSTIGRGKTSFDSRDGYTFLGLGTLIVSNGVIDLQQSEYQPNNGYDVAIKVGGCITVNCHLTTTLVSEGSIAVSTAGSFSLENNVSYGTRNLILAVSGINLGTDASIAAAAAAGHLPAGLVLNDTVLSGLLAGNTAIGAPALETLALNARNSVNVFGSVTLDASKVGRLVFGTPAIYGYGASGDVATIRADELIWTGLTAAPGAPIGGVAGDGTLNIAANRVVFGYSPNSRPDNAVVDNRIVLGFSDVGITASQSVTSNNKSTLAVYHSRGAYDATTGYQYSGGNLTIATPLFTGAAGSSNAITAGGDIRIVGGGAVVSSDALGGQLKLTGANVTIDTSVVLPSGRLTVAASGDLVLGDRSRLDLAGRAVTIFDVTKYSWGGDLVLTSNAGSIRQDGGSVIDLSAQNNRGGTATVTALGSAAGQVALNGTIRGGASGIYDAGGTYVPYDAAEVTVQAQTLVDFAGLNARLNAGSVFGTRRFQIKQGDLVVGSEVKARNVEIVLDGGSLTVNGTIDASGYQVGSIRLAAMNDLTIAGLLDAHGTGMRFDSYGLIIDAANRASVDLTARQGTLTLSNGAAVDLRAGTAIAGGTGAGLNDGVARGTLTLNARRLGGTDGQGGIDSAGNGANDVAINVIGTPSISGAKTVAVYGYRTYDDAPLAGTPDITGHKPQEITQAYLDGFIDTNGVYRGGIDPHSKDFIDAAGGNADLTARLARLGNARLRPGVDITSKISADNPNGDLTVNGDLDLSKYRYGPNADRVVGSATYGFGEPGAINIRAAGDLNIRGTITDGFAPPPATAGDNGWRLEQGVVPYGGEIVLPTAVTLDTGTLFKTGVTLNYNLPTGAMTLPVGTVLPVRATLTAELVLGRGTVVDAVIYNANGSVAYAAGTVLTGDVTLAAGMQLDAGTVLRSAASIAALTWPKGVPLPVDMISTAQLNLAAGSLIPAQTNVKLPGGTAIDLRDASSGRQGANWAVAAMLPAGAKSWDIQLTAGADLGSADMRARNPNKTGSIVLADTHYASLTKSGGNFANLNEAGAAAILAAMGADAGGIPISALVGKSEAEIVALFGGSSWRDFVDYYGLSANFWTASSGNVELGLTMQGVLAVVAAAGSLPLGMTDNAQMLNKTQKEIVELYRFIDPNLSWADFGFSPDFTDYAQGNFAGISLPATTTFRSPSFSTVRTGTGDLSLSAAGNISMSSLYGVYTAGTATTVAADYNRPRGLLADTSLLGPSSNDYASATALYKAWYPEQGGNVSITAGGNLIGDIYGSSSTTGASASVVTGNWLWRQGTGTTAVTTPIPTAWWINFGTYVASSAGDGSGNVGAVANLVGFTGIGALGGGNVAIRVGGQAGTITLRGDQTGVSNADRSQGLVVAVGSTGRVGSDGSLTLTGGGDIDMRIAGALNPNLVLTSNFDNQAKPGALIDLRGALHVTAASLGGVKLIYNQKDSYDPRGVDLYTASWANARSGLVVVPGDSTVTIETLGDLVLAGAGDPGRSVTPADAGYSAGGVAYVGGGQSWFSLWTDHTAINLISAGGNLTPSTATSDHRTGNDGQNRKSDVNRGDGSIIYPAILRAVALDGSIYYGQDALPTIRGQSESDIFPFVTLAPSPAGALEMIAGHSIYAGQYGFSVSGTGTPLPTPFNPAFASREYVSGTSTPLVSNLASTGSLDTSRDPVILALFAFGPNSAAVPIDRVQDADPIRFYAGSGDILGLYTGETLSFSAQKTWYSGSGPLVVRAGRDIVGAGLPPDTTVESATANAVSRGNLIVHRRADDVSIVSAGRDIFNANFDILGPGAFEMSAGRNLYQGDKGSIVSKGAIATGDTRLGASVAILAGIGASGPDYGRFAALYLDPANRAVAGTPLGDQPGKVVATYEKRLTAWLLERFGFTGSDSQALTYFNALAPELRHIFLRQVYFAELTAGGREYNDANSPRYGSYLRGREAIAALFPESAPNGGDITMFGPSGVRTVSGGDIQLLTPTGRAVIGIEGAVPPASAGLITQGQGNIQLYAQDSILLGLSRIMTTFGGNIVAWSAQGDINAGRGSKTTTIYTPPKRVYDKYGLAVLSSDTPSAGAGIATLNPIPEVPAGDVDLIAPLGTIDAGEAGIRVSGNVNLAALQILNAANIQVQGSSTGIPTVQAPSISAALSTSNATAASQQTATPSQGVGNAQPSVIIVEVLGYGGGEAPTPSGEEDRRRSQRSERGYNHDSAFQVVGVGELNEAEMRALSETERRQLSGR